MNRTTLLLAVLATAATARAQLSGSFLLDPNGPPGAFRSFQAAVNALFVNGVSGPVEIAVAAGTYTESVLVPPIPGASAQAPVTFRALQGPGTVLLGGAAGDTIALLGVAFQRNRNLVFDGIDFTGGPGHAISGTTHVEAMEIRHCHFAAGHRSGAPGEFRHAIIVSENSGTEAGWRLHHNHFTLSSRTNRTSYGVYLSNGGEWEFDHNTLDMNGGDYGLYLINSNRRIDRIHNNRFVGTLFASTSSQWSSTAVIRADLSNYENYIVHNTFAVTIPQGGACVVSSGIASATSPAQNYVFGNVFVVTGGAAIVATSSSSGVLNPIQLDGNVYHLLGAELGRTSAGTPGQTTLAGWQQATGQDLNSLAADPLLQNPYGTPVDQRPLPGSPVQGAARNTPAFVVDDFAGRLRDAQPDAGAYETSSFALYGSGCAGSQSLVPAIGQTGAVALGSANFAITLQQAAPQTLALLLGGLSRTQSGAVPLPFDLGGGCRVLVSPDALTPAPTSAAGQATQAFPIPNAPGLLGVDLFFQWAVVDPASGSPFGITVSEAGALQL